MLNAAWPVSMVFLASMYISSEAAPLSLREFGQLARECAPWVSPSTLAAIAKVESDFHPLSAHDNTTGETLHWKDPAEATQSVKERIKARHSIDVGLMQINSKNFPALGITPENAFQPCISLSAAATLLESRYAGGNTAAAEQRALRQAISAYNTGNLTRGFANGYVRKVELAARKILPALVDLPDKGDEKAKPEETWDVWAPRERHRSGSDSSSTPEMPKDGNSPEDNQLIFD
ncbi:type IV secretion system protein VirB1 [Sinorhizobium terangae]|uniref:Type IV secretion system lytic transglycosylase VirB1 n=1 Tax=Sinorhizobium terangae TaxID=110322 RepID=A0A6N7LCS0_SINTE|nr:type IV secretion system lytic transglycosylase VirB1 [Sinorhizobium terangae]MBB4189044.1 type IV secretion system protein VirB1 [Sinorhizobium terangae]MQX15657.1 type IV secretion system lytic transglycosylase VirB1 [Sinorhizobium terangae]